MSLLQPHQNVPNTALLFLQELARLDSVEAIILFGSRAVGDHEERSDLDIAVCGSAISKLEWARLRDAAYFARTLYWISLVHFDRNPPALQQRILETGVILYEHKKSR